MPTFRLTLQKRSGRIVMPSCLGKLSIEINIGERYSTLMIFSECSA